ncbi:MAG: hypothetical protein IKA62_06375 [Clostridia bacterium]|nr:hypothetical protein [Clostridia bacterium]
MIEYVVLALMCLVMLIVIAYTVIAAICAIKQHKVQMRISRGFAEAVERQLIKLDDGAEEDTAQDNAGQEDVNGEL